MTSFYNLYLTATRPNRHNQSHLLRDMRPGPHHVESSACHVAHQQHHLVLQRWSRFGCIPMVTDTRIDDYRDQEMPVVVVRL